MCTLYRKSTSSRPDRVNVECICHTARARLDVVQKELMIKKDMQNMKSALCFAIEVVYICF